MPTDVDKSDSACSWIDIQTNQRKKCILIGCTAANRTKTCVDLLIDE